MIFLQFQFLIITGKHNFAINSTYERLASIFAFVAYDALVVDIKITCYMK